MPSHSTYSTPRLRVRCVELVELLAVGRRRDPLTPVAVATQAIRVGYAACVGIVPDVDTWTEARWTCEGPFAPSGFSSLRAGGLSILRALPQALGDPPALDVREDEVTEIEEVFSYFAHCWRASIEPGPEAKWRAEGRHEAGGDWRDFMTSSGIGSVDITAERVDGARLELRAGLQIREWTARARGLDAAALEALRRALGAALGLTLELA